MKTYNFWCDAQGEIKVDFNDDVHDSDIKEEFNNWIESLGEDIDELLKTRSAGYYED